MFKLLSILVYVLGWLVLVYVVCGVVVASVFMASQKMAFDWGNFIGIAALWWLWLIAWITGGR